MTIYNREPSPRVLFEDVPQEIYEELSNLVPTSKLITSRDEIYDAEFDLLVTYAQDAGNRYEGLHVLSVGAETLGLTRTSLAYLSSVSRSDSTMAREATISLDIDAELSGLIERTIIETLPQDEKGTWFFPKGVLEEPETLLALGVERKPYVIRMNRTSHDLSKKSLALPGHVVDLRSWFVWFLQYLHTISPDVFPAEADWASSPRWATSETTKIHDAHHDAQSKLTALIGEAEEAARLAKADLAIALQRDSRGLQQLLTEDGDELEAKVIEALTILGFHATSMDKHHTDVRGARLEDLRVTDPEDPGWTCLAEIKGYAKGVKTNDINQITGKPLVAYMKETGKPPSALWHIVNFKRNSDPSTRGEAVPNDLDLHHLHDLQGKLIDTRQLFLAVRDLQLGTINLEKIKQSLKSPAMRWDYRCT